MPLTREVKAAKGRPSRESGEYGRRAVRASDRGLSAKSDQLYISRIT